MAMGEGKWSLDFKMSEGKRTLDFEIQGGLDPPLRIALEVQQVVDFFVDLHVEKRPGAGGRA